MRLLVECHELVVLEWRLRRLCASNRNVLLALLLVGLLQNALVIVYFSLQVLLDDGHSVLEMHFFDNRLISAAMLGRSDY